MGAKNLVGGPRHASSVAVPRNSLKTVGLRSSIESDHSAASLPTPRVPDGSAPLWRRALITGNSQCLPSWPSTLPSSAYARAGWYGRSEPYGDGSPHTAGAVGDRSPSEGSAMPIELGHARRMPNFRHGWAMFVSRNRLRRKLFRNGLDRHYLRNAMGRRALDRPTGKRFCCAISPARGTRSCHDVVTLRVRRRRTHWDDHGWSSQVRRHCCDKRRLMKTPHADCKSVGVRLPRFESWTCHKGQRGFLPVVTGRRVGTARRSPAAESNASATASRSSGNRCP
jgi:hypothetical protein